MNKYLLKQYKEKALDLGVDLKIMLIDEIQAFFLEEFYKHPASNGVVLFGGGRFRHINNSIRFSIDLDFFRTKGFDYLKVVNFISGRFIELLKQKFGVEARIIEIPPWQESPGVESVRLLIYDKDNDFYQIELDFDFIMREPYSKRSKGLLKNVVISIGNNAEVLEEKLISIYERVPVKARDIFDLWYYRELSHELSRENIHKKLQARGVSNDSIRKRLNDFISHKDYYLKEITNIIKSCGEKRPEVNNLLKMDMDIILDFVISMTRKYLLGEE